MGVSSSSWIECYTPDGHKFFHDLLTQTPRWELPFPPPPVASIPLPPFPPADSEDDDSEDDPWISREKMWEHERLERAACAMCVSNVYGTIALPPDKLSMGYVPPAPNLHACICHDVMLLAGSTSWC